MLFNPNARRFTFRDLRALAVMTNPALKKQLDASTKAREFAEHVYSQCRHTQEDQRLFGEELTALQARSDVILKTAYEHVRQELAAETLYGFGTKPPVTPQSAIDIILPHYWLFLQPKPETSEVSGHGVHYVGVFFQRKEDVPPETIALMQQRQDTQATVAPTGQSPTEKPTVQSANDAPYLQLTQEAAEYFKDKMSDPLLKKHHIMTWLVEKAATSLGIELSARMAEAMATSIRPLESKKGGAKPQRSGTAKQPADA